MKLGNVIEEIEKCNDKKFEANGYGGSIVTIEMIGDFDVYNDVIVISVDGGVKTVMSLNGTTMGYDWTEVILPVSFEEALHLCTKYGREFIDYEYGMRMIKNPLGNVVTISDDTVHNTNGVWYERRPDLLPF